VVHLLENAISSAVSVRLVTVVTLTPYRVNLSLRTMLRIRILLLIEIKILKANPLWDLVYNTSPLRDGGSRLINILINFIFEL